MNPVLFAVEMLSGPMGEHGSSMGYVISGGLNPNPALEADESGEVVYVDAASPQEAIRQAFVGSLLVNLSAVGKPNTSYTYSPATVGLTAAEHKAYLIQPLTTTTTTTSPPAPPVSPPITPPPVSLPAPPPGPPSPPPPGPLTPTGNAVAVTEGESPAVSNWQIALEDMAAFPEADWDYNDHFHGVRVTDLEYEPTGNSVISGKVWDDTGTPDGTSFGDPGVNGVAVDLYRNGLYKRTVYTDNYGAYSFTQLPAGEYRVEVASDPFRVFVPKNVGPSAFDSDVDADGKMASFELDGSNTKPEMGAGVRSTSAPQFVADGTVYIIPSAGGWRFNNQAWAFASSTELRVAKWEKAFTSQGAFPKLIEPDEFGHDFIDIDPDRFYVLVKDSTAGATLDVTIATDHPTAAAEYKDDATTITLTKLNNLIGWGGWYLSDSQMLVSNKVDDKKEVFAQENKLSPENPRPVAGGVGEDNKAPNGGPNHKSVGGGVYNFAVSDRTHIVALGGKVQVVYKQNPAVEVPVKVRGVVKVHINNMRSVAGGDPAVAEAVWEAALKEMRENYAQVGLDVRFSNLPIRVQGTEGSADEAQRLPPASAEVSNPPNGAGLDEPEQNPTLELGGVENDRTSDPLVVRTYDVMSGEEQALLGESKLRTITKEGMDDIEVYYVRKLSAEAHGVSITTSALRAADLKYKHSVVVAAVAGANNTVTTPTTLAHEVGHVLEDRVNIVKVNDEKKRLDVVHFPYTTKEPAIEKRVNLMVNGGFAIESEDVIDSRRLTREQEARFYSVHPELIFVG